MSVFAPFKYYLDIDLRFKPSEEELENFRKMYTTKKVVEIKKVVTNVKVEKVVTNVKVEFILYIDNMDIGKVIGTQGVNIARIRNETKCHIKIYDKTADNMRKVFIHGKNAEMAKKNIMQCIQ